MRQLKFISERGEVNFCLDKPTPFVFNNLLYSGKPEIFILSTQAAKQDGETLHAAYYEPREMEFSGYVYGPTQYDMYQNIQVFNAVISSKTAIRIEYTNDHGSYYIYGIATEPVEEGERIEINGHYKPITLVIRCSDPMWRAISDTEEAVIAYRNGRFQFPFSSYRPGVTFGQGGYRADIVNLGDNETGFEMWIKGPAILPSITNLTTGLYMAFSCPLQSYETLYINTNAMAKTVELINETTGERIKALDKLEGVANANFDFWKLVPGINSVQYDSGSDNIATATVTLKWASAFAGV